MLIYFQFINIIQPVLSGISNLLLPYSVCIAKSLIQIYSSAFYTNYNQLVLLTPTGEAVLRKINTTFHVVESKRHASD